VATGGHSLDLLIQGAGAATYAVVSNSTDNSISIINASDNTIKQNVPVGLTPGGVMIYYPGAAAANNQAVSSVVLGGGVSTPSVLPERLDDHGMKE
jgi:YVTN family beta-propeller protein